MGVRFDERFELERGVAFIFLSYLRYRGSENCVAVHDGLEKRGKD
jgi:hypothetical protein